SQILFEAVEICDADEGRRRMTEQNGGWMVLIVVVRIAPAPAPDGKLAVRPTRLVIGALTTAPCAGSCRRLCCLGALCPASPRFFGAACFCHDPFSGKESRSIIGCGGRHGFSGVSDDNRIAAMPASVRRAMDDVEFVGAARDVFEQGGKRRSRIDRRAAQP